MEIGLTLASVISTALSEPGVFVLGNLAASFIHFCFNQLQV